MTISSHVAVGAVGNRALVFALEALGLRAAAVATVQLPFHPGHGPAARIALPAERLETMLGEIAGNRTLGKISGIVSGYFADPAQVEVVAAFIGRLQASRPRPLFLCDPVIGDAAGLYVPQAVAAAIRDRLIPLADAAAPNRFELAWLVGEPAGRKPEAVAAQARGLGPAIVLVTSAAEDSGRIANLLVTGDGAWLAGHARVDGPRNGPGDLTAGLFGGHLALGRAPQAAPRRTTAAVVDVMRRSRGAEDGEMLLAGSAALIAEPRAKISVQRLPLRAER